METTGDQEVGNRDALPGKKRPKAQMLRSRLFGKMKKKKNKGAMKHTQSASDITLGILDLDDDLHSSQNMLGARSLSHDSIFLADQCQSDPDPPRVLSQENIHGKIRTLQMKLQQQNIHLGPPPLVLPIKRADERTGQPETDEPPQSPSEISGFTMYSPSKPPVQPASARPPSPWRVVPVSPPVSCPGVDFSSPPKFSSCLDSSAARHRMSVKPRNQRASTKSRRPPTSVSRSHSERTDIVDQPLTESEEVVAVTKEITDVHSYSSQIILPGEGLTAPPIRNTRLASPRKSLTGAGDECLPHTVSQPEGNISPSTTCLLHPIAQQHPPVWETASTPKPEFAESSPSAIAFTHAPKVVEATTGKPPSSATSTSMKGGEDHREIQSSKDREPAVNTALSIPHLITMESEQNTLKSDKGSYTVVTQEKDALNKNRLQDISQDGHPRSQPLVFPQSLAVGVALRPPSQRRNTAPLDDRVDGRNLQTVSTVPPSGQVDKLPKESTNQSRPVSGSLRLVASPAKCHERQRTASFTGVLEQTGSKREFPPPPKYSKNLKTQDQLWSTQLRPKGREPCANLSDMRNERPASIPVVPTKPKDLTPTLSAGRERGDDQSCETQERGVEVTRNRERVQTVDEAKKYPKGNNINEEGKQEEEKNAFGVRLRTTSLSLKLPPVKGQSDLTVKQQKTEVNKPSPAWVPESPAVEGDVDSSAGSVRGNLTPTVFKKSLTPNTESLISTQDLSTIPQSDGRDQERTFSIRMAGLGTPAQPTSSPIKELKLVHPWAPKEGTPVPRTPKEGTPVPLTPREGTPVPLTPKEGTITSFLSKMSTQVSLSPKEDTSLCMLENPSLPTGVKEPQEPSSQVSWMSMAREKTRSLQQLFTSKLPEFPGLQSTSRPTSGKAASPQTQTSTSQSSGASGRPTHHISPAQHVIRPSQASSTPSPAVQTCVKETPPSINQSAPMEYSRPPQPTTEAEDLFLKQTLSATGQTQLSAKPVQPYVSVSPTTYSTTKPVQPAVSDASPSQLNPQTVQKAKQVLHTPLPQAHLVQGVTKPSEPQAATLLNLRTPQPSCLRLSPSPKLTPRQTLAACASSPPRPQVGVDWSSALLGRADLTPVPHEKSPVESRAQWAGSLGSKAFPTEHSIRPTSKVEDQVSLEHRSPLQSAFRTMSTHSKFTEASGGPMWQDREDKYQKTTVPSSSPPSSSSPPQSVGDSGQPSWMELAKRKSLAWSDKTMD